MKFLKNLSKQKIFGKICLLRVDLNIQTDLKLRVSSSQKFLWGIYPNLRIEAILSTIKFLTNNGAKVVLLSHRGKPQQNRIKHKELRIKEFSLKPFEKILSQSLKKTVHFINFNKNWKEIFAIINDSKNNIFLLENLRFLAGEEKNDKKLAKKLALLGDFYVNDAFSVCHRKAASLAAITKFLPSYAGLLLEKEINNLDRVVKNSKKPFVVILGGAKISDKLGLIKNFLDKADYFLIGGGIANTFFAAQNLPIGDSLYEKDILLVAKQLLKSKKIILPIDVIVHNKKILDIGLKTAEKYAEIIKRAKTIIWNGPMGYFEDKKFAKGSEAIVKAIISNKKAISVIGGGETASIIHNSKFIIHNNIFVSTGGGAMLEYLAGKKLPGIKAL